MPKRPALAFDNKPPVRIASAILHLSLVERPVAEVQLPVDNEEIFENQIALPIPGTGLSMLVRTTKEEKYGRMLADCYREGEPSLCTELLERGLARPYLS